jgi:hypothetical protein
MNPTSRLHRFQQKVLAPEVHVVLSPRGYGRTYIAEHCDRGGMWTGAAGIHPIDVQPHESADMALRYANHLRKWTLEHAPRTRPVVFMRREQWTPAVKNSPRHVWLSRLQGAVVTLDLPPSTEYADVYGPIESLEKRRMGGLKDAWGHILPATYRAVANGATVEQAAMGWVGGQPEHRLLMSAVPDEGYYKTPVALVLKRIAAAVERGDDQLGRYNCDSAKAFLEWLELIGAGQRVSGPSWEWTQLWLTGCRELVKRHV